MSDVQLAEPTTIAESLAEPTISETLSWTAICERYPDQWVCIVEIDRNSSMAFDIRSARVVGHGKTRKEPLIQARPWWAHHTQIGHYFTGPMRGGFLNCFLFK